MCGLRDQGGCTEAACGLWAEPAQEVTCPWPRVSLLGLGVAVAMGKGWLGPGRSELWSHGFPSIITTNRSFSPICSSWKGRPHNRSVSSRSLGTGSLRGRGLQGGFVLGPPSLACRRPSCPCVFTWSSVHVRVLIASYKGPSLGWATPVAQF